MKKYFEYIVIGLLLIMFVQGFFKKPEGITEAEHEYMMKIHDLNQEKHEDAKIINDLKMKNRIYENFYDSLEADNSLDTVSANKLQSALSNYAASRR